MLFTTRFIDLTNIPVITFNNTILEWVLEIKYLGIILDNKLSFNSHIDFICKKLSKAQGILYASSKLLCRNSLCTIYFTLCYSILIQSFIIWGKNHDFRIKPIKTILNNILRIILNVKRNNSNIPLMHTNEMFLKLKFLKYDDILDYFYMSFLNKILDNDQHVFYNKFYNQISDNSYNFRRLKFILPHARIDSVKFSPFYQCLFLYNNLPTHLTTPMSKNNFKKLFKEYAFNKYIM